MRSRLLLITVAILMLAPLSVFADPVTGELDFNGSAVATLTSVNFLCDAPGGPSCSSNQGNFIISPISTGTFAGLSTSSTASYGHILNLNNALTPPGETVALSNFVTFDGLPGVTFTLTKLNLGTGGGCPPAPGTTCTPTSPALINPSNPLGKTGSIFEDTATGSSAQQSVDANAVMTSPSGGTTAYTGTFTASFNGMTTAQVLAELANGGSVTVPYAAKFTPVGRTIVPEPGTVWLFIGGLLVLAGAGFRRFSQC